MCVGGGGGGGEIIIGSIIRSKGSRYKLQFHFGFNTCCLQITDALQEFCIPGANESTRSLIL